MIAVPRILLLLSLATPIALACHTTAAQDAADSGLQRRDGRFDVVDWRPGAGVGQYRRIAFLDPFVEFRDDWLRDQNRGKRSFNEVTEADMDAIRRGIAADFLEVFTEVMEDGGAYRIDAVVGADDLLLLRPAILNVDVSSDTYGSPNLLPDSSFVKLTLYLELYDSATSTQIGRIVDGGTDENQGRGAVRRVLQHWAEELMTYLREDL